MKHVIILSETLAESLKSDLASAVILLVTFGINHIYLDDAIPAWVLVIILLVLIIGVASKFKRKNHHDNPESAIKEINTFFNK